MVRDQQQPVLPYLSRFAIARTEVRPLDGFYCSEKAMWMMATINGPRPAIECAEASLEIRTKTEVTPESDEDSVLELLTKTLVQSEQDDDHF